MAFENHTIAKKSVYNKHDRQFVSSFVRSVGRSVGFTGSFFSELLGRSATNQFLFCSHNQTFFEFSTSPSTSSHFRFVILCNCAIVSCHCENYVETPFMDVFFILFPFPFLPVIRIAKCKSTQHKTQIEINICFFFSTTLFSVRL